jgi:hypothetical protein
MSIFFVLMIMGPRGSRSDNDSPIGSECTLPLYTVNNTSSSTTTQIPRTSETLPLDRQPRQQTPNSNTNNTRAPPPYTAAAPAYIAPPQPTYQANNTTATSSSSSSSTAYQQQMHDLSSLMLDPVITAPHSAYRQMLRSLENAALVGFSKFAESLGPAAGRLAATNPMSASAGYGLTSVAK